MNRAALYELVWAKPVTHVAREFGLSDVAIRKICVKHDIPTPPLGYWNKLQHGKKVSRPQLPPLKKGQSDSIKLEMRPHKHLPAEVAQARQVAELEGVDPAMLVSVPTERPAKLHALAEACEKMLRKAKPDNEGFLSTEGRGTVNVKIGPVSVDRVVRIIHAFVNAAVDRGYKLSRDGECWLLVDEQPLAVRIYESKEKAPHTPTAAELKRQAEQDEWRSRIKSESSHKLYRTWDYFPSGRLVFEIFDPKQGWGADPIVGRWRDRSAKKLEDYLSEAIAALKVGAASARYQRAKEEEEARIRQDKEERRREQERQRRLLEKVSAFMMEKAETYAQLTKLENLAAYLANQTSGTALDMQSDLNRAIEFVLVNLRNRLSAESIAEEIARKRVIEIESW